MSPEPSSIRERIRHFILEVAEPKGVARLTDDESLVENGVLDSLSIMRVVQFLEDTFAVWIGDEEIVYDNFQSINQVERFVMAKLNANTRGTHLDLGPLT